MRNYFQVWFCSSPITQNAAIFGCLFSACLFCSYYETKAVFLAMGITVVVCVSVTIFCFQTKVEREVAVFCLCVLLSSLWLVSECPCCQRKRTLLSHVTIGHWVPLNIYDIWDKRRNCLGRLMQLEIERLHFFYFFGEGATHCRLTSNCLSLTIHLHFPLSTWWHLVARHRWTLPPAVDFSPLLHFCSWSLASSQPSSFPSNTWVSLHLVLTHFLRDPEF